MIEVLKLLMSVAFYNTCVSPPSGVRASSGRAVEEETENAGREREVAELKSPCRERRETTTALSCAQRWNVPRHTSLSC